MSTNISRFALPSLAAAAIAFGITTAGARVDPLACDLARYKAAQGLTAAVEQDLLVVSWNGQAGAELRARYAIDGGRPVIRDLGIRKAGGCGRRSAAISCPSTGSRAACGGCRSSRRSRCATHTST